MIKFKTKTVNLGSHIYEVEAFDIENNCKLNTWYFDHEDEVSDFVKYRNSWELAWRPNHYSFGKKILDKLNKQDNMSIVTALLYDKRKKEHAALARKDKKNGASHNN